MMHRPNFPSFAMFLFASWVMWGAAWGIEPKGLMKPPNILFIMSDDHTTQAIGAYGSRLATLNPTPNIDALAKNGMRFDQVFCHNSICTPSRASIITGQYSQQNGVLDLDGNIPPARQFLPIEMKKLGYQTAMIGKWHLKEEPAAFDYYCVLPGQGKYFDPDFLIRGDKPWPANVIHKNDIHSSDAITDLSLEWLKNGRDKSKPFFLMHHFKAPHDMFENAKRYDDYLKEVTIPEPDNLFNPPAGSEASRGMGSGIGRTHSPWGLAKRLKIPYELNDRDYAKASYQEFLKRYLRCVKGVDDNVERLLSFLKETGELDNTVIIYTADQGYFLGEHDLMDKRWIYDEAMRMPFIVQWPNIIPKGSVNHWLINNTDFAPTLLEIAGRSKPEYMQGRSFASALRGENKPDDWRTVTYYRYWMHMAHNLAVPAHFGIRSDRYKLIFFYGITPQGKQPTPAAWEFYDLEKDPHEMLNQYANPAYKELIADMKIKLKATRTELNENDEKNPAVQAIIDANWSP
jgi:N-acetylglucosamine-6-sulfatase